MMDRCSFPDTEQRLHLKKTTTAMSREAELESDAEEMTDRGFFCVFVVTLQKG